MDEIVRAVSGDGFVVAAAVSARGIVERARRISDMSPVATAALGRCLCAASIMGDMMKEEDASLTLRINGGGVLGTVMSVSDSGGNVRGYVQNPGAGIPNRPDGKLNVGGAVGRDGFLTVSRDVGLKEPYVGSVKLVNGEIAEDLAAYFAESEQLGTACALGVLVSRQDGVLAAGGIIISLLPGSPEELIEALERNIYDMGPVTNILSGHSADELVRLALRGLGPEILSRHSVEYRCNCSSGRVINAILSLGETEIRDIIQSREPVEVSCQFCDKKYNFGPEEIELFLDSVPDTTCE